MTVLRRKRLPAVLETSPRGFVRVLAEILEPAKQALTEATPTTAPPGRPLPDALAEFEGRLAARAERMQAWRRPAIEREWWRAIAGHPRSTRARPTVP